MAGEIKQGFTQTFDGLVADRDDGNLQPYNDLSSGEEQLIKITGGESLVAHDDIYLLQPDRGNILAVRVEAYTGNTPEEELNLYRKVMHERHPETSAEEYYLAHGEFVKPEEKKGRQVNIFIKRKNRDSAASAME